MKTILSYLLLILAFSSGCSMQKHLTMQQKYSEQTSFGINEGKAIEAGQAAIEQKSPVGLRNYNATDLFSDEGFISKPASIKKTKSFDSISSTGVGVLFHGNKHAKIIGGIALEHQALAGLLLGTLSFASLLVTLALLVLVGYIIVYPLALSVLFSAIGLVVSIKPFKNRNAGILSKKGRLNAIWGFWLNAGLFGLYFLIAALICMLFFVFHVFVVYSDQPF